MDNFHVLEVIGRGKYATVYKGRKKNSFKFFAIKSVDKSHKNTTLQEVRILQSLDHSNILKLYDWYETSTQLWLILEYCGGGDLRTLLKQDRKLPEDSVHDLARGLVGGLRYLHSKGIIYCDLKPSNILLDENGCIKLCDFRLSRELSDISKTPPSLLPETNKRGTPCYMAPELFHDGGVHSYASDLWALGCVLYECYAGRPPFRPPFVGKEFTKLVKSILTDPTPSLPDYPSRQFADLVSCLLIKDPKDRIKWSEICIHAFWTTQQLSPVALPPQPAFDDMIERNLQNKTLTDNPNEISEGVNLLRLSKIAKSNLQRENNIVENDTTDIKIENRDMELDFNEYTEDEAELSAATPTVDENSDQEERIIQHEIDSSHVIKTDDESRRSEHESEMPEIKPSEVLWHDSDLSVLPVMPQSKKFTDEQQSDILQSLSFDAIPSSDFVKLPTDELDVFTKSIVTILDNGKNPIGGKQNVIRYLEMLISTNEDAANILINGSIMPILVKMLRQSKVSALRVQLASLIFANTRFH